MTEIQTIEGGQKRCLLTRGDKIKKKEGRREKFKLGVYETSLVTFQHLIGSRLWLMRHYKNGKMYFHQKSKQISKLKLYFAKLDETDVI